MKTISAFLFAFVALHAQSLQQGERQRALSELHATAKMFTDSIDQLTPVQWNFQAAPERWSIAECAEHIVLSEDMLFGLVQSLLKQPANPPEKKVKDEEVLRVIADRGGRKATAPEALRPAHKFSTPQAAAARFKESREMVLEYVRTTSDPLRVHFQPHPALGPIDAYQWILLIGAHTDRHVQQIQEVKAAPGFPK
jgi:hypothetical protein